MNLLVLTFKKKGSLRYMDGPKFTFYVFCLFLSSKTKTGDRYLCPLDYNFYSFIFAPPLALNLENVERVN